ncbi:MAG: acyl carrier protein [Nonomuraea sp.]|nr:acyl carrier protein [Nonomuraea sp.]NUT41481.1 acyl carrier protein [Thermoactinospora sp.]NUP67993.1 acyl carrier protein [Nonomuraea sp.]NUP79915.1 acyl carrier protein [Nonomuraea sp.]NUR92862.1 acyl carrier protein [Nonomuraea sp.]
MPPDPLDDLARLITLTTRENGRPITGDSRFEGLGGWSSLTALRLLMMIEQRWGVALDLRAYLAIETVGDLAKAITAELDRLRG